MNDDSYQETSNSIHAWAEAVFGSVSDFIVLVRRTELEMAELRHAVEKGLPMECIRSEAADVAILLHRLAALSGGDLGSAVNAKMAINRQRQWTALGDGTGQHKSIATSSKTE